ncbi:cytochrome P450 [Aspergillus tetrazonus]
MLEPFHLLILGAITALGYILSQHGLDPREPPEVHSKIPIIGHLLGLMRHGMGYFSRIAAENSSHPIFTINLLTNKQYIVTSPSLMQAVQRNKRTLKFAPLVNFTAERFAGIPESGMSLLRDREAGGAGLSAETVHAMEKTLIGPSLDRMNEEMARMLSPLVDELVASPQTVDLYAWCTRAITAASTNASYGPKNPYKDSAIADAFWTFETNIAPLITGIFPSIMARKAYRARETTFAAVLTYFQTKGHEQGSELTKTRYRVMHDGGLSDADIARAEVSMGLGLLSNTVPAAFWVLFDLYSRPSLLCEIRGEVMEHAVRVEDTQTPMGRKHIIDISALRGSCPLLVSAYQEILRTRSASAVTRVVTEDTVLDNRYFLKKGGVVSIPASAMGAAESVWGPESASEFNPKRYMRQTTPHGSTSPRRTGGFMSFGVSPTICPGRHFASSEILALVAMVILRIDLTPVDDGAWKAPEKNSMAIASGMCPVKGEFWVKVARRECEGEGVEWGVEAREGSGMFNLMVG